MLIARGNKDYPGVLLRSLHIVLKETSARGCDVVALRQRVHLGTKGAGANLPVVVRYTIGTTSAIFI